MGSNHLFSSPGLVEDTRNLLDLEVFLTKKSRAFGIPESRDHHQWMPVKYRDLIYVPHLRSRTHPWWATRCTSWWRTWTTPAGCHKRRFFAVFTPDIIPKWLKWPIWPNGDSEGGVPHWEQHGGPLHVGKGGRQGNEIHSHIKVSVETSLYLVFIDISLWTKGWDIEQDS